MEFVVVTAHKTIDSCHNHLNDHLNDMNILSIPEPLLVYTACQSSDEFKLSIINLAFAFDCRDQLTEDKYCCVNGSFVFSHLRTHRTAVMCMISEKVLLPCGKMYSINKINNIKWQENNGVCEFIGVLEARIRLRDVTFRVCERHDQTVVCVPLADISECTDSIKQQLKFLRCEFGVNIVYFSDEGTKTHRSVLLPSTLICTDHLLHNGLFSIVTTKPGMRYIRSSPTHLDVFGVAPRAGDVPCDFDSFIQSYHSEAEMRRIRLEVLPVMREMSAGDVFSPILEFVTPRGIERFKVTMHNVGRSCLAVTFAKTADSTT